MEDTSLTDSVEDNTITDTITTMTNNDKETKKEDEEDNAKLEEQHEEVASSINDNQADYETTKKSLLEDDKFIESLKQKLGMQQVIDLLNQTLNQVNQIPNIINQQKTMNSTSTTSKHQANNNPSSSNATPNALLKIKKIKKDKPKNKDKNHECKDKKHKVENNKGKEQEFDLDKFLKEVIKRGWVTTENEVKKYNLNILRIINKTFRRIAFEYRISIKPHPSKDFSTKKLVK